MPPGSPNPDPISDQKNVIFHTRFQTCRWLQNATLNVYIKQKSCHVIITEMKTAAKKAISNSCYTFFLIRLELKRRTRWYTTIVPLLTIPHFRPKWTKSIYPFQDRNGAKTPPFGGGTYLYGLYKGVSPGNVPIMFPHLFVSLSFDIIGGTLMLITVSIVCKITKIARALWLAERSVCMRVSVNTVVASRCFAFCALMRQARIWKSFPVQNSTSLFYLPIPSSVEIFTNKPCQFFFRLSWHFER